MLNSVWGTPLSFSASEPMPPPHFGLVSNSLDTLSRIVNWTFTSHKDRDIVENCSDNGTGDRCTPSTIDPPAVTKHVVSTEAKCDQG